MKNLSFDDGRESFTVNDNPDRVIRFNPADPEIINRIIKMQKDFENYSVPEDVELNPDGTSKSGLEKDGAYIADFTSAMRKAFNEVFNADVFDTIFDGQSPLCIVGQKYLFEGVLEGLVAIMKPAIEKYAKKSQAKVDKYIDTAK